MPRTSVGSKEMPKAPPVTWATVSMMPARFPAVPFSRCSPRVSSRPRTASASFPREASRERYLSAASPAKPFSISSCFTPSSPILSILSRVMSTESAASSGKPAQETRAFRILRSFTRTVKELSGQMRLSAVPVAVISSISARLEASPRMSMSHWVNCRKRPFWGRSALQTEPTCSALKGCGSFAPLFA